MLEGKIPLRRRSSLIEDALPELLLQPLQTLAQLQHRAEHLSLELATLKQQLAREIHAADLDRPRSMDLMGHERIVIADDQPILRTIAAEILEGFGYHILLEGGNLRNVILPANIDLVLLDVPLRDAMHLERIDSALHQANKARLVVSTTLPEGAARADLRRRGVQGFISKPYHPVALARCIRQVLCPDLTSRPCARAD